ncbi:MAG: hypothetical protein Q8M29_00200 [Bacteroidota bacterium]|nr:hypothetical protein [Bacteroidota bacterium]
MNNVKLNRKELYDLVWSMPMTALAKKYLISDSGLRKICVKMEIPLPKAGHWEKLKAKKEVEIIKLSTNYNGNNEISLELRKEGDENLKGKQSPEKVLKDEIESDSSLNIVVPDILTKPHKLIVETKNAHINNENRHSKNFTGYLRSPLSISATKLNYSRALRIMDTFIKAMEQRGHVFQFKNDSAHLVIYGEEFAISIREKNNRIPKPKTGSWQEYDYIPSGILVFSVRISYHNIEWTDGRLPLENQLSKIVAKIEIKGSEEKEMHLRWEKEREIQAEQDRIKKAKEQEIENELVKFKLLKKKAELWREAGEIRAYLRSLEEKATKEQSLTDELKDWLKWAHKKVDWYDPNIEAQDPLMEGVDKENLTFKKSGYY